MSGVETSRSFLTSAPSESVTSQTSKNTLCCSRVTYMATKVSDTIGISDRDLRTF